ncbi:hypothetical protein [Halovivax sp.]|uniref:hypothetical protein n=1 Tax=Halovivax sp. TaxID=1935978 RepID=UPI0025C52927|nr:hypothetical protein [Halovivax sp.]
MRTIRNVGIYLAGVGAAVAGALGIAEAIHLHPIVAAGLFVVGLAAVLVVHEYLDGPL